MAAITQIVGIFSFCAHAAAAAAAITPEVAHGEGNKKVYAFGFTFGNWFK